MQNINYGNGIIKIAEIGGKMLVHQIFVCFSNRVGRSGAFVLVYVGMQNINYGNGIINIPEVGGKMLIP